jgi:hypothetical protein
MNGDDLRAVAAEIREPAERMLGGAPWTDGRGKVRNSNGFPIAGGMGMLASAHMAAWHPGVALAVADWLDDIAESENLLNSGEVPQSAASILYRISVSKAYAFVKAWRGEQS